jgi:hypothetical protein
MEPQRVVAQFLQLPADAQRVVADLIAYLDRREAPRHLDIAALAAAGKEATILPPFIVSVPADDSSETPVVNLDSQRAEFVWDQPDFDFRAWRRQVWERPKAQL